MGVYLFLLCFASCAKKKGNDNAKNCTICILYIPFRPSSCARVTSIINSYLSRVAIYKSIHAATFFEIHRGSPFARGLRTIHKREQ